jgi:hypothetical protein
VSKTTTSRFSFLLMSCAALTSPRTVRFASSVTPFFSARSATLKMVASGPVETVCATWSAGATASVGYA